MGKLYEPYDRSRIWELVEYRETNYLEFDISKNVERDGIYFAIMEIGRDGEARIAANFRCSWEDFMEALQDQLNKEHDG